MANDSTFNNLLMSTSTIGTGSSNRINNNNSNNNFRPLSTISSSSTCSIDRNIYRPLNLFPKYSSFDSERNYLGKTTNGFNGNIGNGFGSNGFADTNCTGTLPRSTFRVRESSLLRRKGNSFDFNDKQNNLSDNFQNNTYNFNNIADDDDDD